MATDFAPLDLLYLYRDQILSILSRHGIAHPRVRGLAARGAALPPGVAVEILVDALGSDASSEGDLRAVATEIEKVITHPVVLDHCAPGREDLLPGEQIVSL